MPIDLSNPGVINSLLESYEKESVLRTRWINRHKKQIYKAATFSGAVKNYTPEDVSKSLMLEGMATLTRDHSVAARNRLVGPGKDLQQAAVKETKPSEPPMFPIKNEEQDLIRESRKEYLKARNMIAREDKFNFVECASWQYGWKLGDSELKMRGPAHGRIGYMKSILESRVGPQPDPEHYASPDATRTFCESCGS